MESTVAETLSPHPHLSMPPVIPLSLVLTPPFPPSLPLSFIFCLHFLISFHLHLMSIASPSLMLTHVDISHLPAAIPLISTLAKLIPAPYSHYSHTGNRPLLSSHRQTFYMLSVYLLSVFFCRPLPAVLSPSHSVTFTSTLIFHPSPFAPTLPTSPTSPTY